MLGTGQQTGMLTPEQPIESLSDRQPCMRFCALSCFFVCQVPGFRASKFKVTNGEFAAFVRSQGYQTRKWWSEEGWGWRTFRNVKWPTFWVLGESPAVAAYGHTHHAARQCSVACVAPYCTPVPAHS